MLNFRQKDGNGLLAVEDDGLRNCRGAAEKILQHFSRQNAGEGGIAIVGRALLCMRQALIREPRKMGGAREFQRDAASGRKD